MIKKCIRKRHIDVKGDGNCLFRVISLAVYGDEAKHKEIRILACNMLLEHEEVYKDQIFPQLL